ncbi:hypothetical protein D3C73_1669510 [compost metagenome]
MVHAVNQINIGGSALGKHDLRPARPPAAVGMASLVLDAAIALRLDDPAADLTLLGLMDERLPQQ